MERLQAAIEKARTRRQDAPQHAPVAQPDSPATGVETAWNSLASFAVQGSKLRKNRLVAFESGADAGPYDMLRTRMLQQAQKNDWRRIAIVSPHAGCGKTTSLRMIAERPQR